MLKAEIAPEVIVIDIYKAKVSTAQSHTCRVPNEVQTHDTICGKQG